MSKPKLKATRATGKHVSRENVDRLRGKFKGKGLLKALIDEKKKERQA